jgi:hypothetical protein
MDNFIPDEPMPRSPHIYTWEPLYFNILQYLLCVLWIVRILNLSTLREVRISNFESVFRVMRSEKLVRIYGGVHARRVDCMTTAQPLECI